MRARGLVPTTVFDPQSLDFSAGQSYNFVSAPSNAVTYSGANLAALTAGRNG